VHHGLLTPTALRQLECYEAAVLFARTEGIIPAPETSHAIKGAIDEALKAKEEGREKVIVFSYSGHGLMDLAGYQAYFADELRNYPLPPEVLERSLAVLEGHPKPPGE
jgi:tryptophan synthase beta chain